jgi:hypothetical protein
LKHFIQYHIITDNAGGFKNILGLLLSHSLNANSAGGDWGPCSWVCASLTSLSPPIGTSGNFRRMCLGGGLNKNEKFLINLLGISGNSKQFSFFNKNT